MQSFNVCPHQRAFTTALKTGNDYPASTSEKRKVPRDQFSLACSAGPNKCTGERLHVICMASERRVARVSKQIEREIGTMLQADKVLQNAVCPEYEAGYDSSVSALASVTEVKLSSDLQVAKIYLSVFSDDIGRQEALRGLSRLEGYVRTRLAKQMQLRSVPEIRFYHDDAAQTGEEVLRLLEKIKRQDRGEEEMPPVTLPPLPQDERAERKRENDSIKAQRKGDKEKAEDGFLNFEGIDSDEGFLKDDELSDSDDEEIDVVDAYLGKKADPFDYIEEPILDSGDARGGKQRRSRQKRRFRTKTR